MTQMKMEFEAAYKQPFKFRLAVTDLCWSTVHALCTVSNKQEVGEYAVDVFKLSKDELSELQIKSKTWLISCAAHTMKRFSNSVKKKLNIKGFFFYFKTFFTMYSFLICF
jgi:hypothetical protein